MFLLTWDSGAASIKLCQVLVEFGMTNPKSKFHSSKHLPLNRTFCSILNFSIGSIEEKLISLNNGFKHFNICLWFAHLDTALHLRIFFGTLASCSSSGILRSSLPCNKYISGTKASFLFPVHLPQNLPSICVTEVHPINSESRQDVFCFGWHFVNLLNCDDDETFLSEYSCVDGDLVTFFPFHKITELSSPHRLANLSSYILLFSGNKYSF